VYEIHSEGVHSCSVIDVFDIELEVMLALQYPLPRHANSLFRLLLATSTIPSDMDMDTDKNIRRIADGKQTTLL
jgi:hypothetical protein